MRREEILLYLTQDRINIYFVKAGRETIIDKDTSLFFEFGEISNERECEKVLTEILSKMNFSLFYLKPNLTILYNDVCKSDIRFLYRCSVREVNFNSIYFVPITKLVKNYIKKKNIVVFDKNYYTDIDSGEKFVSEELIDFEQIYIGKKDDKHSHYSESNILWETFKSYFTKIRTCDKMDVGDDE